MLVNTYAHIQQSSRVELGKKFEEYFYAKTVQAPIFRGLHSKKERQILRFGVQYLVHLAHSYPNFSPLSQLPRKRPFLYLPYN